MLRPSIYIHKIDCQRTLGTEVGLVGSVVFILTSSVELSPKGSGSVSSVGSTPGVYSTSSLLDREDTERIKDWVT